MTRSFSVYLEKDRLERAALWSKILSSLIIPFIIAALAFSANKALKKSDNIEKRIELSIDILSSKPLSGPENLELRRWAVQTLNDQLSLNLSADTQRFLENNKIIDNNQNLIDNLQKVISRPPEPKSFEK